MDRSIQHIGLTTTDAEKKIREYGKNSISEGKSFSAFRLLIQQYTNVLSLILLAAAIFSLVVHEPVDSFFIFIVLIINGIFGFFQEFRAEKTLEKLRDLVLPEISVIRDGAEVALSVDLIVPGDIVVLREGDKIPADGELVTKVFLEVDESIFTGESLPVEKKKGDLLSAGTFILRGEGRLLVGATGDDSKLGQIAKQMQKLKKPKTPLAENLESLGRKLAAAAVCVIVLLIPIGMIQGRELRELVLTAISLSVAVIPEGLPLVVTISLAVGGYRMMQKNAIVRKMSAIETLGSTTIILSDKTGTLTQNKMRAKTHWLLNDSKMPTLLRACVTGNSANLALKKNGEPFDVLGDKTDGALLLFAKDAIEDLDDYRSEGKIIEEKPFDSQTKLIETTWEDKSGKEHIYMRGAPESIMKTIGDAHKVEIDHQIQKMAQNGLRVIGFAHKSPGSEKATFIGLIGIYDAPRLEAAQAIKEAKKAGIRVVMVTGDNPITAFAIAKEIEMLEEKEIAVTSDEIAALSDDELKKTLPRVRVFARMKPEDKLRLVRLYKELGYIVAVTGDGVNDSLALTEANIGVAMGIAGTDVAKEAADMIITDDNLATIVKAVEEGRAIFENIVRVVVYLLSSNAAEFLTVFLGILFGLPIPLTATQILWINLVSDGFPALALATDDKRRNVLNQKPRDVREQIVNKKRLKTMAYIAVPLALFTIALFSILIQFFSETTTRLIVFNVFVVCEMIIAFIVRGGFRPVNKLLIGSVLISLLLQLLLMMHPVTRAIFS